MTRIVLFATLLVLLVPQTSLAKPTKSQHAKRIENLTAQIKESQSVVRFWNNKGRWATAPDRKWCWSFVGEKRERLCLKARRHLRAHQERLAWASRRIAELRAKMYLATIRGQIGNMSNWLCIYSHEHGSGGWATNTGNGYYGGLQMDMSFQEAHGLDLLRAKGTANNWSMYEQMMVAERAHDGLRTSDNGRGGVSFWQDSARGYNPWPRTARMCGLL